MYPSLSARTTVQAQNYSFHLDCCSFQSTLAMSVPLVHQIPVPKIICAVLCHLPYFSHYLFHSKPYFLFRALITVVPPLLSDLTCIYFLVLTFLSLKDTSLKH